ncbi:response regulator [Enterovirga sp.]|uniref:response regulator n=1 Tax=Enterovirga sp. TaxID=2026350 RepID=UPI002CBE8C99|nr:response regulator [Enterovirga sp.]HMO28849.1 response regulator [Enterovirga sp.]
MTALIVEDDRGQSELAALLLEEFDLRVIQVASAEEALGRLCDLSEEIGVVLIDIHLEGEMDGLALAERVAVLWPTLSVLVTSGDVDAAACGLPPRATFIPKPWRPLDIVAAAERAARADHSVHALRL